MKVLGYGEMISDHGLPYQDTKCLFVSLNFLGEVCPFKKVEGGCVGKGARMLPPTTGIPLDYCICTDDIEASVCSELLYCAPIDAGWLVVAGAGWCGWWLALLWWLLWQSGGSGKGLIPRAAVAGWLAGVVVVVVGVGFSSS